MTVLTKIIISNIPVKQTIRKKKTKKVQFIQNLDSNIFSLYRINYLFFYMGILFLTRFLCYVLFDLYSSQLVLKYVFTKI